MYTEVVCCVVEGHDSKVRPQSAATSAAAATKRPATSGPAKPLHPVYVDLTYIPSHADAGMVDVDFFKRVRARHYVLSASQVDPAVLDMLVEGKASWGDATSEVTVIPTYDSDTLIQWMALRKDDLDRLNIDVAPSANRCTIQLQDHTTSCSAFRLEF
jgi:microtubule-associated protein 1